MGADDPRVDVLQVVVGQPQALGLVAPQVVDYGLALGDQGFEDLPPRRRLQVQGEAALVAVESLEEVTVAFLEVERPDLAADVAAVGRVLDLDHLGAQVGHQHGAEGPGAVLLHGDHAHAFERQAGRVGRPRHQTGFRSISRLAMSSRCSSLVPSPIASSGASR